MNYLFACLLCLVCSVYLNLFQTLYWNKEVTHDGGNGSSGTVAPFVSSFRFVVFVYLSQVKNAVFNRRECELAAKEIFSCVESNLKLLCFYSTSLLDWSRKLAPPYQPIRCKTKFNHDLVACVFPRFGSLVGFTFSPLWLLLWLWFNDT